MISRALSPVLATTLKHIRVISAKMLATCLHMMKGTPYIYQGEELGMTNVYFDKPGGLPRHREYQCLSISMSTAVIVKAEDMMRYLKEISRDNARTPMQWDSIPKTQALQTGTPWINVNPNYKEINAKAAVADPNSVFHYYQELIKLRHTLPIIVYGKFQGLLEDSETIYAYTSAFLTGRY